MGVRLFPCKGKQADIRLSRGCEKGDPGYVADSVRHCGYGRVGFGGSQNVSVSEESDESEFGQCSRNAGASRLRVPTQSVGTMEYSGSSDHNSRQRSPDFVLSGLTDAPTGQ
ncbi:hypothetical protein [Desulfonema ishimotonii]|uniref:hypothetical protein n=1 Tax=Desulfonema ishimotonii TaxID=45657 RepID=UPI000F5667C4|nr:hypothetical protein [Desulfonema ishimotonii]